MVIEVMSTEFIKPATPTPHNLNIHKLSLRDQLMHSSYSALVFFYLRLDTTLTTSQISRALKSSLSQTLTRFYPFAGKIKDRLSIQCDDGGVSFLEARAQSNLSRFLDRPDPWGFQDFVPRATFKLVDTRSRVAMIQMTTFTCGGITVGTLVAHLVADGVGMSIVLRLGLPGPVNPWTMYGRISIQRGRCFLNTKHSRKRRHSQACALHATKEAGVVRGDWCMFDSSAIARMKDKAASPQV
ncbi:hypothetical protein NL676_025282 [Syzygium grande]|nr:hypothetical protein NL676_025282 [Syzygium grande]